MQTHREDPALGRARSILRAEQNRALGAEAPASGEGTVTEASLARYEELTRFVPDDASDRVRRGPFTYDPGLEGERIARGEALIRRVQPGPFEDANYFAMLAYQAASIEMAYGDVAAPDCRDGFSRFLLGTAHSADVNAFAERSEGDGYTVVVLNSGLVDFVYQAARVMVAALDPVRTIDGRGMVHTLVGPDTIRSRIISDPAPGERLYRTLEAYFFKGYPRASAFESVPEEQHPTLALTVSMAERWIIGHEYGHGLAPELASASTEVNLRRAEEYFADFNATATTVLSACKLDAVPPEFPLGGAIFALACLDLLQRAFNTLLTGDEKVSDAGSVTHPAPRDRADAVVSCFRRLFDVEYHQDGLFDLWYRPRLEVPNTHGFTNERSGQAYQYAEILQAVWPPVRQRLIDDYLRKRPLHPMWQ
jgi:hypothetical protein